MESLRKTMSLQIAKVEANLFVEKNRKNEDPEFISAYDRYKESKSQFQKLSHAINKVFERLKASVDAEKTAKVYFMTILQPNISQPVPEMHMDTELPNCISSPLNEIKIIFKDFKSLKDKRKKFRILLKKEQEALAHAEEKKKNVQKHQEAVRSLEEKYQSFHQQFISSINKFTQNKAAIYQPLYNGYKQLLHEISIQTEKALLCENTTNLHSAQPLSRENSQAQIEMQAPVLANYQPLITLPEVPERKENSQPVVQSEIVTADINSDFPLIPDNIKFPSVVPTILPTPPDQTPSKDPDSGLAALQILNDNQNQFPQEQMKEGQFEDAFSTPPSTYQTKFREEDLLLFM
ncbi:hypothetical protein GPJ56_005998 [Histomonas meleagridis]|uniref:uncharacterized protein n=1 Tax=Histomonas meleagridis TaxID=135588 RepID=UPI003559B3D3|nr:hypothetical protein GPJ56_005998 [Histomonas meleagridis]KAH0799405.1 hypothetical protein GO595_007806 [Histomonas meleagridis]